jgi:hypothetical protein
VGEQTVWKVQLASCHCERLVVRAEVYCSCQFQLAGTVGGAYRVASPWGTLCLRAGQGPV